MWRNKYSRVATATVLFSMLLLSSFHAHAAEQKWLRVSSAHFSILTDAGESKAQQALLRFEQMRALFGQLLMKNDVNISVPIEMILLKDSEEYASAAPSLAGKAGGDGGFFIPGEDRAYIVLDASNVDNWRAVSLDFTNLLLNFNYPPAQPWFDAGFPEYLSSLRFDSKHDDQAYIGGEPAAHQEPPFTKILNASAWMTISSLFNTHPSLGETVTAKSSSENSNSAAGKKDGFASQQMFYAESWMVVHYLVDQDKLSEMGTYFGLVEARHIAIPNAIQQAFGDSPEQFEQTIKDYYHSSYKTPSASQNPTSSAAEALEHAFTLQVGSLDIGTSRQDVPLITARALIDEMKMRIPERRAQAATDLESLIDSPAGPSSIEYRAFAWANLQQDKFADALQNLGYAARYDQNDPWVHFYSALTKYRQARATHSATQGLANMLIDLRIVIDFDPEFAEAHDLLAQSRLEGGGLHSAAGAALVAIRLAPRRHDYVLHLAQIYLEDKKWDQAEALLKQLKDDPEPEVAETAQHALRDLPTLRKYGVPPESDYAGQGSGSQTVYSSGDSDDSDSPPPKEEPAPKPKIPKPDTRRVQFLKAKLLSVNCANPPAAILTISANGRNMRLRTEDYTNLAVVGADKFSCSWRNVPVAVNFKAGGKYEGDLVSIELR